MKTAPAKMTIEESIEDMIGKMSPADRQELIKEIEYQRKQESVLRAYDEEQLTAFFAQSVLDALTAQNAGHDYRATVIARTAYAAVRIVGGHEKMRALLTAFVMECNARPGLADTFIKIQQDLAFGA